MDERFELPEFDFEAVFEVDDYIYFYGEMLTDEYTDEQVRCLVELLELRAPADILDLACGYGRHANRLAALGHRLTGVDLTPGFLEIARKDALARGLQVRYQQGDMRQLDFQEAFDVVLLLFTAFGYFSDEQNFQVLQKAASALKPGGLLVLDVRNRDEISKRFLPYIVMEKNGDLMIDRNQFDSLTGRMYNRRIVIRNGVRKDKPFFIRMYNPSEITGLLEQAGLQVCKLLGGYDGQPVSVESRRMVIIAKKPIDNS
ncbi:MAG: methyltransferase domain-containing protein [Anaerolineales bacterium]|nr:methyltransferase domain-containing protein [Anaerolineales bacterium]